MRIAVGSDHAAFPLKVAIVRWLREAGHAVVDVGPATDDRVDYPDFAFEVARQVAAGTVERGVLTCGTGIGMSMAANKVAGVRAALVHDPFTAEMAAAHNDANVLCMGGRLLAEAYAIELVRVWLATPFEERHQPRLDKIARAEIR